MGQVGAVGAAPADLDPTFGGGDGIATTDLGRFEEGAAVARQADGKLVVVGRTGDDTVWGGDLVVTRYTRRGEPDPAFGGGDGVVVTDVAGRDDRALGVALQRDGRIVVAGETSTGETGDPSNPGVPVDFTDSLLVRYTPDGQLDRSFGGGDGIAVNDLSASGDGASEVAVLPGGRIVTSGTSNTGSPIFLTQRTAVTRYASDGTLDPTFGAGGVALVDGVVRGIDRVALATQRDGKILVTGETDPTSASLPGRSLAAVRLLADGSLDTGFGGGDGIAATAPIVPEWQYVTAHDVRVQPDGKVVVAGTASISLSPAAGSFALARFTPDGAVDPSFGSEGDGVVRTAMEGFDEAVADAVAFQRDGRIVAAGSVLDETTRTWRQAIARYNPDGSLDTTFDGDGRLTTPAIGVASPTSDVLVQPDGRIVTAGSAGPSGEASDIAVARFQGDPRRPGR